MIGVANEQAPSQRQIQNPQFRISAVVNWSLVIVICITMAQNQFANPLTP
jgi:hypothetical protein